LKKQADTSLSSDDEYTKGDFEKGSMEGERPVLHTFHKRLMSVVRPKDLLSQKAS